MKKRAYCKMMHISGTTTSRFSLFKNSTSLSPSFENFLLEEERYHKITDTNDLMNHSKYFIDISQFEDDNKTIDPAYIVSQLEKTQEIKDQMKGILQTQH